MHAEHEVAGIRSQAQHYVVGVETQPKHKVKLFRRQAQDSVMELQHEAEAHAAGLHTDATAAVNRHLFFYDTGRDGTITSSCSPEFERRSSKSH